MKILESLVVAFQFLTRLYLPINVEWDTGNLRRSLMWFGLVGAVIGTILAGFLMLFNRFDVISAVAAIIILIIWIFITGGMHIDGISDMADGFFSMRDKEQTLEIMKDSHVGAFGVMTIVFVLLIKFEMLKEFILIEKNVWLLVLPPTIARIAAGLVLSFYETTKKSGLGYTFHSSDPRIFWTIGFIVTLIISAILNIKSLIFITLAIVASNLMALWAKKKIGGLNGDIYGAIVETVEIIGMVFICVV